MHVSLSLRLCKVPGNITSFHLFLARTWLVVDTGKIAGHYRWLLHVLYVLLLIPSKSCFLRARSIYERALDVDYRNITLWLKYAEMEMKNRQVNHARNIWDRAITTLPRVNQFW